MNGDDTATEVLVRHLTKSCIAEDLAQPFLIRKRPDRCRKVFVDAGTVAGDDRADERQELERIPIVQGSQPAEDRAGEFQAYKTAAGLHHPANFPNGLRQIPDVSHAEPRGDRIEDIVTESEMFRAGLQAGDFVAEAFVADLLEAFSKHGMVQV